MKTIVVPTDFSTAADHALSYAAQLARQLKASVLLLHVYQLPVTMTDYPVLMVSAEDLKKTADEGLEKTKETARQNFPDVEFETESRLGNVADEVEDLCNDHQPFALVAGTKDLSGFERFLFGNTTLSLIKRCSHPVVAVPEEAEIRVPANVVLATDLQNLEEIPVAKITDIINTLQARLHVVHIEREGEETASPATLMDALQPTNATFHSFKEDDVAEGLKHFVEENKVDLVLVLPHKHNLYERLFFKGHTEGILRSMPVPVMSMR